MKLENARSRSKQHEQKIGDGSDHRITQKRLRTPHAAALAGILFSLLLGTSIALVYTSIPKAPLTDADWLTQNRNRVSIAITLVPFAGIAFLWLHGRDPRPAGRRWRTSSSPRSFWAAGCSSWAGSLSGWPLLPAVLASHDAAPGAWGNSNADIFGRELFLELRPQRFMFQPRDGWKSERRGRSSLYLEYVIVPAHVLRDQTLASGNRHDANFRLRRETIYPCDEEERKDRIGEIRGGGDVR